MSWNLAFSGHDALLTTDAEHKAQALRVRKLAREFWEKLYEEGGYYANFSGFDGSKNLMEPEDAD